MAKTLIKNITAFGRELSEEQLQAVSGGDGCTSGAETQHGTDDDAKSGTCHWDTDCIPTINGY